MYPYDIPGISPKYGNEFVFNENSNEQTLRHLIGGIPPETTVAFYDKDYPSPSDPGAYVSFMLVDEQYMFQRANHGWSSSWEPINIEELVSYLSECASYNDGSDPFERMFVHFSIEPSKPKKWWHFWK